MSHPHPLSVVSLSSPAIVEGVHPSFLVDGLHKAREKTIAGLQTIRSELKEGMSEDDGRKLALKIFADFGITKHWHRPFIRFGAGTTLTFSDPIQPNYRLQPGDPYFIDLGPVWSDPELGLEYEGDYGDTFVFGENAEAQKCADHARQIFLEAKAYWNEERVSGEALYQFIRNRADSLGYLLAEAAAGHRIGDFPHHKHSKEALGRIPFVPKESLWVLEVQILDGEKRFGAFFEDLL